MIARIKQWFGRNVCQPDPHDPNDTLYGVTFPASDYCDIYSLFCALLAAANRHDERTKEMAAREAVAMLKHWKLQLDVCELMPTRGA